MIKDNEKDIIIGKRLRQLRQVKGFSQQSLATDIGVTFQQVQKYETGRNRLSVTRMLSIAVILKADPIELYKELLPEGSIEPLDELSFQISKAAAQLSDEKKLQVLKIIKALK